MQNNNKLKKFINKLTSTQRAQGAIEYLLIIGVAIIIVAVAIIALSGVLSSATEETSQKEYYDSYADLKYQHIGFPISVKPGEHILFTLVVQPKNNLLPSIFSEADTNTIVVVNDSATYQKTPTGWTTSGDTAKINQGDNLEVSVPATATKPLNLVIKGNYTAQAPRKIYFDCDGTNSNYISYPNISFEPKEKRAKIIFKDFFDNLTEGSNLNISGMNSYYSYYAIKNCEGTPCTTLNEPQCNDTWGICAWNYDMMGGGYCYTQYGAECSWFQTPWSTADCTRMGCQNGVNTVLYSDMGYPDDSNPSITIGDTVSLTCVPGQVIHAELEESLVDSLEKIDQLTIDAYSQKTFMLKNYSCYSFRKLYDQIKEMTTQAPTHYVYLYCSRKGTYSYAYSYNMSSSQYDYFEDSSSMLIYPDTTCTVYTHNPTSAPIQLTC